MQKFVIYFAIPAIGVLGWFVYDFQQEARNSFTKVQQVQQSLDQLHSKVVYHSSDRLETRNVRGYPVIVDQGWFDEADLPHNAMVGEGERPWIDVAPPYDFSEQPPDPVLATESQATFWYNPNLGIFRARVPEQKTERATLTLYNRINDTQLASLPLVDESPGRKPIAMVDEHLERLLNPRHQIYKQFDDMELAGVDVQQMPMR